MQMSDIFSSALRTQGYKITKNRTAILSYLTGQKIPVSAEEILEHVLQEHQSVNKTTIYRELFFLIENNFIHEVEFGDGKKRYEIVLNRPHHHHIICVNCKNVEDIPLDSEFDLQKKNIEEVTGYKVESHMLEFFGLCKNCK